MTRCAPLLVLALLLGTGCTTSFTHMTPTRALEPLDFELSAHGQASIHGNVISKSIDGGKALREGILDPGSDEEITEEQLRDFLDAAIAFFLFKPGTSMELSARVGGPRLLEGMDFGIRYDFTTIKGDWKQQWYEDPSGMFSFSSSVGIGKQTVPVPGAVEWLTLSEWSRTDFDFMLSAGVSVDEFLHAYINPRLMLSRITVEHKLPGSVIDRLPDDVRAKYDPNQRFENEMMVYYGATVGAMVGYKYVFLAAELTLMKLEFEPTVLGQTRNFDSLVASPALGLVVTW